MYTHIMTPLLLAVLATLGTGENLRTGGASSSAGGVHIVMDFDGFVVDASAAGEWLLNAMSEEVAAAGVQEVHRKLVVLGTDELTTSPPGFTSAVLIDESHVTAHCYSDRGWLAVDVFTCGRHEPTRLADAIHARIAAYAPQARCVQRVSMPRFLHLRPKSEDPPATLHSHRTSQLPVATSKMRVPPVRMAVPPCRLALRR